MSNEYGMTSRGVPSGRQHAARSTWQSLLLTRVVPRYPSGPQPDLSHSYCKATIGFTRVARRAGTRLATTATAVSRTAMETNTTGSVALTS